MAVWAHREILALESVPAINLVVVLPEVVYNALLFYLSLMPLTCSLGKVLWPAEARLFLNLTIAGFCFLHSYAGSQSTAEERETAMDFGNAANRRPTP